MKPAEWNQIFEVFHAAREKSGGERVMLLDSACGENTLLGKAVEELLGRANLFLGLLHVAFDLLLILLQKLRRGCFKAHHENGLRIRGAH